MTTTVVGRRNQYFWLCSQTDDSCRCAIPDRIWKVGIAETLDIENDVSAIEAPLTTPLQILLVVATVFCNTDAIYDPTLQPHTWKEKARNPRMSQSCDRLIR